GLNNEAYVRQGSSTVAGIGQGASANIWQLGAQDTAHFAAVMQTTNSDVNVTQRGTEDGNQAFVEQRLAADGALANIEQDGEANYVDVLQEVAFARADVLQLGNFNVTLISQTDSAAAAMATSVGNSN